MPAIQLPGGRASSGRGRFSDGPWWIKFGIDVWHALKWRAVQELGHGLNCLSLDDRLPTTFQPVSPPPCLHGGPEEHLSWVVEAETSEFSPADCAEWLEGRLPRPVDDLAQWAAADENAG